LQLRPESSDENDERSGLSLVEDVRAVLKKNEAPPHSLQHADVPPRSRYPQDLHDALANPHLEICYSTIQRTDLGPTQTYPPTAAACGSVGIVVDLAEATSLLRVHNGDAGEQRSRLGSRNGRDAQPSHLPSFNRQPHDRPQRVVSVGRDSGRNILIPKSGGI